MKSSRSHLVPRVPAVRSSSGSVVVRPLTRMTTKLQLSLVTVQEWMPITRSAVGGAAMPANGGGGCHAPEGDGASCEPVLVEGVSDSKLPLALGGPRCCKGGGGDAGGWFSMSGVVSWGRSGARARWSAIALARALARVETRSASSSRVASQWPSVMAAGGAGGCSRGGVPAQQHKP
jgi:hypothetical protein